MTGEKCSFPDCFAPVEGYCQVCKRGFCKAHLITENIQTKDGRLQYVTVCPACYDYVKSGKYKGAKDNKTLALIMFGGVILLVLLFAFIFGGFVFFLNG